VNARLGSATRNIASRRHDLVASLDHVPNRVIAVHGFPKTVVEYFGVAALVEKRARLRRSMTTTVICFVC
jgi:hypothetical protein